MTWARRIYFAATGGCIFAVTIVSLFAPKSVAFLVPGFALLPLLIPPPDLHFGVFLPRRAVWIFPAVLACYVLLSSLWSEDVRAALVAGGQLILLLVCMRLAVVGLVNEQDEFIDRLGRYFVAAFFAGALILVVEVFSESSLHRALYNALPILRPTNPKHISVSDHMIQYLSQHELNRSIGLLNMLLWPSLLMLSHRWCRSNSLAKSIGLYAITALVTLASEHETSMVALVASTIVFLTYRVSPRSARLLVAAGWLSAMVLILPAARLAYATNLHLVSWLPENARARIVLWAYTVEQIPAAPYLGVGAQTVWSRDQLRLPAKTLPGHPYAQRTGAHSHNIFLQTWYELGLVGALLLIGCGIATIAQIWSLNGRAQVFASCTFVSLVVISSSSWGMWQSWFMAAWVLTALLTVLALEWVRRCPPEQRSKH